MKKILSLIVAVILLVSVGVPVYASEKTPSNSGVTTVTNEYLNIKALASESTTKLMKRGYDVNQIEKIRDYKAVFIDHVDNLNQMTDAALIAHGYTADQISTIRNFSGTENELIRVSANLTFTAFVTNYRYNGTRMQATLGYNFRWAGLPALATIGKDVIAAGWNDYLIIPAECSGFVTYYKETNSAYVAQETATLYTADLESDGAGYTFFARKNINGFDCYAKHGYGSFSVESDGNGMKDFIYTVEYGQNTGFFEPSFSVIGGPDIDFSWSIRTVGEVDGRENFEDL